MAEDDRRISAQAVEGANVDFNRELTPKYTSLFLMSEDNYIRRFCKEVAMSKPFEFAVLGTIIASCIIMALNAPLPGDDRSQINLTLESSEVYLLGIFSVEAILKIIAMGLILHPGSYLRTPWNILDFVVVVTGYLSLPQLHLNMNTSFLKVLRAARVLRPLKLISGIPSLQVVMKSLAKALVPLMNICVLLGFFMLVCSIIGLQLLQEKFLYVCVDSSYMLPDPKDFQICGTDSGGTQCTGNLTCSKAYNFHGPMDGSVNFDNIFYSFLTVFACLTSENWTDIMHWSFDALERNGYLMWIYYYVINVIGAKFMLNLVLGVLSGEFAKERARVEKKMEFIKMKKKQQSEQVLTHYNSWINKGKDMAIMQEISSGRRNTLTADQIKRRRKKKRKEDHPSILVTDVPRQRETTMQKFFRRNRICRFYVRKLVKEPVFYWSVVMVVILNTVSVSSEHYRQPDYLSKTQDYAENVFLSIFILELCLRLYGLGPQQYFISHFNKFDAVIVVCGIIETIVVHTSDVSIGLSAFRAMRLLRLFKFTRHWVSLNNLVRSLMNGTRAIASLLFLLMLSILVFSLLGMQLLGGSFQNLFPPVRQNFDDIINSMLSVFQVMTGSNWTDVMYPAMKAKAMYYSIFFVIMVLVGNYTLLNVFLAIAVDNLTNAHELNKEAEAEEQARLEAKLNHGRKPEALPPPKVIEEVPEMEEKPGDAIGPEEDEFDSDTEGKPKSILKILKRPGKVAEKWRAEPILQTRVFFMFGPTFPVRRFCHWVVNLRHFDNSMLAFIMLSGVCLAIEDPLNEDAVINQHLKVLDYVFSAIFTLEVLLKVISVGLVFHKGAYLRDPWNILDILVVACGITSILLTDVFDNKKAKRIVKVLKVLRVLRPLKAINKAKKLKAVFQCMIFSLKNVFNILMIATFILFIYAVMGVKLFKGNLDSCNDRSKMIEGTCKGSYVTLDFTESFQEIKYKEREWNIPDMNFNNVFSAMDILFVTSTGELWPQLMLDTIDSTTEDRGPSRNHKLAAALYFVIYVILFTFFILNVFVALIILTFQEQGDDSKDCEIDKNQKACLHFAMVSKPITKFMPEDPNSTQYLAWRAIESVPFEYISLMLIVGNTLLLMAPFSGAPELYSNIIDYLNYVFSLMFTVEAAIKIFALRLKYFKDGWNIFDFIIVISGLVDFGIYLSFKKGSKNTLSAMTTLFRLFRTARLIKLLRRGYTLRILLWTFFQSFKALPYVCSLIFLLFYIYSIVGMQLFSDIDVGVGGKIMDHRNNFSNFLQSFAILFRVSTGESWQDIMLECAGPRKCDDAVLTSDPKQTCGSIVSFPYFISFVFLCTHLMLNLFVAVIMDNFEFLTQDESILGPHHLDEFVQLWADYDPKATGRIKHTEVCQLLRQMSPPIGLGHKCPKVVAYKRLIRMNMPLHPDNTVDYRTTLFSLVRTALNIMTANNNLYSNDIELRKMLKRVWPKLTKKTLDSSVPIKNANLNQLTVGKIYCAKLIYENYKQSKKETNKGSTPDKWIDVMRNIKGSESKTASKKSSAPPPQSIPMAVKASAPPPATSVSPTNTQREKGDWC